WEAASRLGLWRSWVFPSPAAIGRSFWAGVVDGTIPRGVFTSMRRLVVGYLVSLCGGVGLGLLLARSRPLRESIGTVVTGLQALPSICWLPLALLWFGLSETAILFVVVAGSLLAITVATEAGVSNVPPLYVRAARTMGARGATLYLRVILPAALPAILSGMRLGWTFAWRSLMAGELLFVSGGLGQLLATGRELGDMARVMAVMVAIVTLGLVTEVLFFKQLDARVREVWGTDRA
ncbi:MAG TPA: ABC transporter permease, partial [Polyangia bacterium]|nr:ABC transporter permease [Polyangia bacterium]